MAGLGDIDGDGFGDLLIGGPEYDRGSGAAWLVRGPVDDDLSLADAEPIVGLAGFHRVGTSVASAGDLDGDGLRDLVIGAPRFGPSIPGATGAAHVLLGPAEDPDLALAQARLDGAAVGDEAGASVAGLGDLDGDGRDDLAIGAPGGDPLGRQDAGQLAVVLGPVRSMSLLFADAVYQGERAGGRAGQSVSRAGDTDGDGVLELWIGAPEEGRVWRVPFSLGFGSLADAPGLLSAESDGDRLGATLAGGEDLDGDGYDDLAVGAPGSDRRAPGAGAVYLVSGPVIGEASVTTAIGAVEGLLAGDRSGSSAALQCGELLIGASGADGAALFRTPGPGIRGIDEADAWLMAGPEGGSAVTGAGDTDHDRALDWLIGARSSQGSATLVFGN